MTTKTIKVIFVLLSILCIFNNITSQSTCETATVVANLENNVITTNNDHEFWYTITATKDCKIRIEQIDDSDNYKYLYVYKECDGNSLYSFPGYNINAYFWAEKDVTYYIKWKINSVGEYTWKYTEEDIIDGENCNYPITITSITDTIISKRNEKQNWYSYTPSKTCEVKISTPNKKVYNSVNVYKDCKDIIFSTYGSDINDSFFIEEGRTVSIYWSNSYSSEPLHWKIDEIDLPKGKSCVKPLVAIGNNSINNTTVINGECWYVYHIKTDCMLSIKANGENINKEISIFSDCNNTDDTRYRKWGQDFEYSYVGDIGEKILIRWKASENFTWSLEELDYKLGDICSLSEALHEDTGDVSTVKSKVNSYWYNYTATKDCKFIFKNYENKEIQYQFFTACKYSAYLKTEFRAINEKYINMEKDTNYCINIKQYVGDTIYWSYRTEDRIEKGETCDKAIEVNGDGTINTTPISMLKKNWYKYTPNNNGKIKIKSTNNIQSRLDLSVFKNCSSGVYEKYKNYGNSKLDIEYEVEKDSTILIEFSHEADQKSFDWTLEEVSFSAGDKCEFAEELKSENSELTALISYQGDYWYTYKANRDCKFILKSSSYSSIDLEIFQDCNSSNPKKSLYISSNEEYILLDKDEILLFRIKGTTGEAKKWQYRIEDLYISGETCSLAKEVESTNKTFKSYYNDNWFKFTAPKRCKFIVTSDKQLFYAYDFYAYNKCGTKTDEYVKYQSYAKLKYGDVLNEGETIYFYFKSSENNFTEFNWNFEYRDVVDGDCVDDPIILEKQYPEGLTTTMNKVGEKWYKYIAEDDAFLCIKAEIDEHAKIFLYKNSKTDYLQYSGSKFNNKITVAKGDVVYIKWNMYSQNQFTWSIAENIPDKSESTFGAIEASLLPEFNSNKIGVTGSKYYSFKSSKSGEILINSYIEGTNLEIRKIKSYFDYYSISGINLREISVNKNEELLIKCSGDFGDDIKFSIEYKENDINSTPLSALNVKVSPESNIINSNGIKTTWYKYKIKGSGNISIKVDTDNQENYLEVYHKEITNNVSYINRDITKKYTFNSGDVVYIKTFTNSGSIKFNVDEIDIEGGDMCINAIEVLPGKEITTFINAGATMWFKCKATDSYIMNVNGNSSWDVRVQYQRNVCYSPYFSYARRSFDYSEKFNEYEELYVIFKADRDSNIKWRINKIPLKQGDLCADPKEISENETVTPDLTFRNEFWYNYKVNNSGLLNIESMSHIDLGVSLYQDCNDYNPKRITGKKATIRVDKGDNILLKVSKDYYGSTNWKVDEIPYGTLSEIYSDTINELEVFNDTVNYNETKYYYHMPEANTEHIVFKRSKNSDSYYNSDPQILFHKGHINGETIKSFTDFEDYKSFEFNDSIPLIIEVKGTSMPNDPFRIQVSDITSNESTSSAFVKEIQFLPEINTVTRNNETRIQEYRLPSGMDYVLHIKSSDTVVEKKIELLSGNKSNEFVCSSKKIDIKIPIENSNSNDLKWTISNDTLIEWSAEILPFSGEYKLCNSELAKFYPNINTADFTKRNIVWYQYIPDVDTIIVVKSEESIAASISFNPKNYNVKTQNLGNGLNYRVYKGIPIYIKLLSKSSRKINWTLNYSTPNDTEGTIFNPILLDKSGDIVSESKNNNYKFYKIKTSKPSVLNIKINSKDYHTLFISNNKNIYNHLYSWDGVEFNNSFVLNNPDEYILYWKMNSDTIKWSYELLDIKPGDSRYFSKPIVVLPDTNKLNLEPNNIKWYYFTSENSKNIKFKYESDKIIDVRCYKDKSSLYSYFNIDKDQDVSLFCKANDTLQFRFRSYEKKSNIKFTVFSSDFIQFNELNKVKILPELNNSKKAQLHYISNKASVLRLKIRDKFNSNINFKVNEFNHGRLTGIVYQHTYNSSKVPYNDILYHANDTLIFNVDVKGFPHFDWSVEEIPYDELPSEPKTAYAKPEINEVESSVNMFEIFKYVPSKDGKIDITSFNKNITMLGVADTRGSLEYSAYNISEGESMSYDVFNKTPVFFKWKSSHYNYPWTIEQFDYQIGESKSNSIEAVELPEKNIIYANKTEVWYSYTANKSGYIRIKAPSTSSYKRVYLMSNGQEIGYDNGYDVNYTLKVEAGEKFEIKWVLRDNKEFYWTLENFEFNEEFIPLKLNEEILVQNKYGRYKFTPDKDMLAWFNPIGTVSYFKCYLVDSKDNIYAGYNDIFNVKKGEEYKVYITLNSDVSKFIAKEYLNQNETVCYLAESIDEGDHEFELRRTRGKWFKFQAEYSGVLKYYSSKNISVRHKKDCDVRFPGILRNDLYINKGDIVYLEVFNLGEKSIVDFNLKIDRCDYDGYIDSNPKLAIIGENFKNLDKAQYFYYMADESGVINISSCGKTDINTQLEVKIYRKFGANLNLFKDNSCDSQSQLRFYVEKGDELFISWLHTGQNYWSMNMIYNHEINGMNCENSIKMVEGNNVLTNIGGNQVWYTYTADQNCRVRINSFENLINARLISGACDKSILNNSQIDEQGNLSIYVKKGDPLYMVAEVFDVNRLTEFNLSIKNSDKIEGLQEQYAQELKLGDITTEFNGFNSFYYYFISKNDGVLVCDKFSEFNINLIEDFGNTVIENKISNKYAIRAGHIYFLELSNIYEFPVVKWNASFYSNSEATIKSFKFVNCQGEYNIDNSNKVITAIVPANVDLSKLRPKLSVSEGATIYLNNKKYSYNNNCLDFTNDVVFNVESKDGNETNNWVIKVQKQETISTGNEIIKFEVYNQISETIIDGNKIICKLNRKSVRPTESIGIKDIESSKFSTIKYKNNILLKGTYMNFYSDNYIRCIAQNGDVNVYELVFEVDNLEGSSCQEPLVINQLGTYNILTDLIYVKFSDLKSGKIKNTSDSQLKIRAYYSCFSSYHDTYYLEPGNEIDIDFNVNYIFEKGSFIKFDVIDDNNDIDLGFSKFKFLYKNSINSEFKKDSVKITLDDSVDLTNLIAEFNLKNNAIAEIDGIYQNSEISKNDFTTPLTYRLSKGEYNKDIVVKVSKYQKSSNAELLSYHISPAVDDPVISSGMFSINVANGTDLTSVTPTFEISENAKIYINDVEQVSGVNKVNLTNQVTYKVVAEDGTEKEWIIKVNSRELSKENDILTFKVEGQKGVSIDNDNKLITVELEDYVYSGAAMPEFTVSDKAEIRNSGIPQVSGVSVVDLSDTLRYEVSAENGDKIIWKVAAKGGTKVCGNDIIEFSFDEQKYPAIIDFENSAIKITVKKDTDISGLIPKFKLSQYAYAVLNGDNIVSDATEIDFTKSVTFIVYSYTGITRHWEVFVEVETNIEPQYKKELDIKLFPNPVSEFINLKFATNPGDNAKFELYNIYGKLLYSESIGKDKNEFKFNVEWLPESTYIAVVRIGDRVKSLKFIKK